MRRGPFAIRFFSLAESLITLASGYPGEVAESHLTRYSDVGATNRDYAWGPGSPASYEVSTTRAYRDAELLAIAAATDRIKEEVVAAIQSGQPIPTTLGTIGLSRADIGTPVFQPWDGPFGVDLFYGIYGTQDSAGSVSDLVLNTYKRGAVTFVMFTGRLTTTFFDNYAFKWDDALKGLFNDEMRHLAMCGWAKPFNVSVTVEVPIAESFLVVTSARSSRARASGSMINSPVSSVTFDPFESNQADGGMGHGPSHDHDPMGGAWGFGEDDPVSDHFHDARVGARIAAGMMGRDELFASLDDMPDPPLVNGMHDSGADWADASWHTHRTAGPIEDALADGVCGDAAWHDTFFSGAGTRSGRWM